MTETEIFKAIESRYGSGVLMAFADLIGESKMTAHKHYEMIVAKAENMDLVTFVKFGNEWMVSEPNETGVILTFDDRYDYFLCLPQHKEACLHWLNGGEAQIEYIHASYPVWNFIDNDATEWSAGHVFMDEKLNIRIKPRKEKRWIAKIKGKNLLASNDLYTSSTQAAAICGDCDFYEIEVEV